MAGKGILSASVLPGEATRPQFTHTIILMHGARAKINAKDYAVLNIVNISGEYSVNKDGTVVVL